MVVELICKSVHVHDVTKRSKEGGECGDGREGSEVDKGCNKGSKGDDSKKLELEIIHWQGWVIHEVGYF